MGREGFTTTQRKKMCLSQQTLEGLRITGKSYKFCYNSISGLLGSLVRHTNFGI